MSAESLPTLGSWEELENEELPIYGPSTVPIYHILASDRPVAIYVFQQRSKKQRTATLAPDYQFDETEAYVISEKSGPSMFFASGKTPDMELTRIRTTDHKLSLSNAGDLKRASNQISTSHSRLEPHVRRPSLQPYPSHTTTISNSTFTDQSDCYTSLSSSSSSLSLSQTSTSSLPVEQLPSEALVAQLFTRPQSGTAPWHPRLHMAYLRDPLNPRYIILYAPNFVNFRLCLRSTPPTRDFKLPNDANQKYYAWKLTTHPSPAHSLLDRRGTCVARFIYGPKGTDARKTEELGRLEIYDPTLPHLTRSPANPFRDTDQEEQGPEDWTEVIVASCDLVVQYWRKMGRRYNSKMVKNPQPAINTTSAELRRREVSLSESRQAGMDVDRIDHESFFAEIPLACCPV
jgi:hypothetical protein